MRVRAAVLFRCDEQQEVTLLSLSVLPVSDTDSLSQGSSAGSLCLEEEDSSSLKDHFDTLASSLNDGTEPSPGHGPSVPSPVTGGTFNVPERFDTDPKSLQPPDDKHFLNPRLSISTRFLSRFQDRIRSASQSWDRPLWTQRLLLLHLLDGVSRGTLSVSF